GAWIWVTSLVSSSRTGGLLGCLSCGYASRSARTRLPPDRLISTSSTSVITRTRDAAVSAGAAGVGTSDGAAAVGVCVEGSAGSSGSDASAGAAEPVSGCAAHGAVAGGGGGAGGGA